MRVLQAGYFQAVPPEWFYAVMTLHGLGMVGLWFVAGMAGHQRAARALRPADARRVVDRLWRHAHRRRAAARGDARRASRRRVVFPLPAAVPFGRHLAARGRRRRCSWRSPSWAWAGRCGPAICCGPSRAVQPVRRARAGTISAGADTPEVPPIIIIATVSFIGVLAGLVAAVVILVLVAVEQLDERLHERRAADQEPDVLLRPHARQHHDVLRRRDGLRDHARVHRVGRGRPTRWSRRRGTWCCCS